VLNASYSGVPPAGTCSLCSLVSRGSCCRRSQNQNHRMVGVGRDLCGSPSPTLLPKQGHPEQAAQDLVRGDLNISREGDSTTSLGKDESLDQRAWMLVIVRVLIICIDHYIIFLWSLSAMTLFIGQDLTLAGVLQSQCERNWQRLHCFKNTEHNMKEWFKV